MLKAISTLHLSFGLWLNYIPTTDRYIHSVQLIKHFVVLRMHRLIRTPVGLSEVFDFPKRKTHKK